jgi:hypothetical protein
MAVFSLKKFLLALFAFLAAQSVAADDDKGGGPIQFLENSYNGLSDKGKFIATAAVGFVGTRVAVNTAMGAVKLGVAAFIAYVSYLDPCR